MVIAIMMVRANITLVQESIFTRRLYLMVIAIMILGSRMFLFLDCKYIEKNEYLPVCSWFLHERIILSRQSGYFYLNKGKCNLNQSKDDFFVERVAKNNS